MTKTLVDYMSEQDYARYNELITLAEQAKAAAPKAERKPRGPLTTEQKIAARITELWGDKYNK